MVARSGVPTQSGPVEKLKEFRRDMSPTQWLQTKLMFASILLLHVIGFGVFIVFVVPATTRASGSASPVLAYTLGLRHAFDADHISAIDNTTRKLMNEGKQAAQHRVLVLPRPLDDRGRHRCRHRRRREGGLRRGLQQRLGPRAVRRDLRHGRVGRVPVPDRRPEHRDPGRDLRACSATMRHGDYDEAELERQLENRGFMYRFFGRWMKTITKEWQMYPVGVVFGMGFDTATEVALLATTALLATQALPWYSIMCLPILFTAGMSLMDTLDGIFMNFAYWLGVLQPGPQGLLQPRDHRPVGRDLLLHRHDRGARPPAHGTATCNGGFWNFMANFNINKAGFVIVGMFVVTWVGALLIWKFGHVEEKWTAKLIHTTSVDQFEKDLGAQHEADVAAGRM